MRGGPGGGAGAAGEEVDEAAAHIRRDRRHHGIGRGAGAAGLLAAVHDGAPRLPGGPAPAHGVLPARTAPDRADHRGGMARQAGYEMSVLATRAIPRPQALI